MKEGPIARIAQYNGFEVIKVRSVLLTAMQGMINPSMINPSADSDARDDKSNNEGETIEEIAQYVTDSLVSIKISKMRLELLIA